MQATWSIIIAAGTIFSTPLFPCSTIHIDGSVEKLVLKSYDFDTDLGHVIVNKRNVAKTALMAHAPEAQPASWTSRYGSVTFNQFGRELPLGGMNEAGLIVEVMWLTATVFPTENKPAVNESQWIQYQLDRFATVADVVAHADEITVAAFGVPVHYLACDVSGACAAFEFLGGKMVIHTGAALTAAGKYVPVLTNDTYESSLTYLKGHEGFGGMAPINMQSLASLDRFARGAALATNYQPTREAFAYGFEILDTVRSPGYTVWQIAYAPTQGKLQYRTEQARGMKSINLGELDFSCKTPVLVRQVHAAGNEPFTAYNYAANKELIRTTFKVITELPEDLLEAIARYPETTHCTE